MMGRVLQTATVGLWALLFLSACGARTHFPANRPIDFIYQAEARLIPLRALREKPLLLSLVRISDMSSQLQLTELARVHRELYERGVQLLVLTIELSEEPMLEPYMEFNELPFGIGMAEPAVAQGQSSLGILPMVPVIYFLNEDGMVRGINAGLITADDLLASVRLIIGK